MKPNSSLFVCTGLSFLLLLGSPLNAGAETLVQALKTAYRTNPALKAERARQRATDEQVPQAKSGFRPTVSANAEVGTRWSRTRGSNGKSKTNPASVGISLTQPLFDGFRTKSAVGRAKANVNAGRQNLLAVEQQVMLDTATAYMDVIRDQTILRLRKQNIRFLRQQLNFATEREAAGEITRTDLQQARARLSLARSQFAQAEQALAESRAFYIGVTGKRPGRLKLPRVSRRIPRSLKAALATANRLNPAVLLAAFNEAAANHAIGVARSDLMPKLNFEANAGHTKAPSTTVSSTTDAKLLFKLSVPLYQGGRVHSQVRESKQIASQRRYQMRDAQRQVARSVRRTWAAFKSSSRVVKSARHQVEANQLALAGVRQEALVGARTTLDILDAQTELLESKIVYVSARRDQIVGGYQLVTAMGKMTAAGLGLSVALYDPAAYYLRVKNKAWGTEVSTN